MGYATTIEKQRTVWPTPRRGALALCWVWCWLFLSAGLWAGNAGGPPGTQPGGVPPPPTTVPPSGGKFVKFQVSVFAPYQEPGNEIKDDSESMGDLAGGKAYYRRGHYLPLVVNFYNPSDVGEEFDVVVQCEVNALTSNAQRAQGEPASRMSYFTELHVAKGAPAEQTFSILMPSDQPSENQPYLMVYIRPKGGIAGYDRKILLDDIDKSTIEHPGLKGSRLILALTQDPANAKAFPRWKQYLKTRSTGGFLNTSLAPAYENIIFTQPRKGFLLKYVPPEWYALSMVNMMLIDRTPTEMTWNEANRQTILQWVRAGGVLVLTGPPDQKQWEKLGLDGMAGVRVLEGAATGVTSVSALAKAFPGGSDNDDKFVNEKQPLLVGKIRQLHDDAFSVATDNGVVLYHERRVGAGAVVVIPWDIDGITSQGTVLGDSWGRRNAIYDRVSDYMRNPALGPFSSVNQAETGSETLIFNEGEVKTAYDMWSSLKPLQEDLMTAEQVAAERRFGEQLFSRSSNLPAHWDRDQWLFRNYLKNSFEKQSPIKLPPTSVVAGFLLLYLFLASPLTWLVMRLLKKTEWSWPVSILLAFLFALFSYGYFYAGKQGAMVCNQVSVVELSDGDPHGVATIWSGLYSPNRGSFTIEFPDVPFNAEDPLPLGVAGATGALMLYDRNINLALAKDEGNGVNITWKGQQPVMKDVYINDRSSQYFSCRSQVDFGEKDGGAVRYTVKRQSASSSTYMVTVTNGTRFPIHAPSLLINGMRLALVPFRDKTQEFRQTTIPAGAKDFELITDGEDLMRINAGQRDRLPLHLQQQVPKAWEDSEFLHDRMIYLNALSTVNQDKWIRGNELDSLLIGWVNAPAALIAVDGELLRQSSQYTGVMQLVVRKPGWQNLELRESYMIGPLDGWSFTDSGQDPADPENENAILPLNRRNVEKMLSTQVKRYGGLVNFWYQRNEPLKGNTQSVVFKAPIDVRMPDDSEPRRLKVNSVEFTAGSVGSRVKFDVTGSACWMRFEKPGSVPKDSTNGIPVSPRSRDRYWVCFEVPRSKLEKFAIGEKCHFQVELQVTGSEYIDSELLVTVNRFTAEEH